MNIQRLKLLKNMIDMEAVRSKKSKFFLWKDYLNLRIKRGLGLEEYYACGYAYLNEKERENYLSIRELVKVCEQVNVDGSDEKWRIYNKLKPYFKRECVHMTFSTPEEIEAFVRNNETFFAKDTRSFGGKGVKFVDGETFEIRMEKVEQLKKENITMLEGTLIPNKELGKINPYAVNALRFLTVYSKEKGIHFFPSVIRFGSNKSRVDNVSSGGFFTMLDENGVIALDGFFNSFENCQKGQSDIIKIHPLTGISPYGFQIPLFEEAKAMVKEMAEQTPELAIAAWDMAITDDSPALIEVNNYPGADLNCNYYFTDIYHTNEVGQKAKIEEYLNIKIDKNMNVTKNA